MSNEGTAPPGTHEREYEQLLPLFRELADAEPGSARHEELRERLITGHLPIAEHLARRYRGRDESHEDLVQVARFGLINAVDRYEPGRGNNFASYAVPTILGELRRHFRDAGWSVRMPRRLQEVSKGISALSQRLGRAPAPSELADHLGIELEEVHQGLEAGNAYQSSSLDEVIHNAESISLGDTLGVDDLDLVGVEDAERLRPLLANVPQREKRILFMRFVYGMSQTQIARDMDISQMHVSRLLTRTLGTLRERAQNSEPDSPAVSEG
ncbi:SigB/SigF/SigG family RNA polymerase sigma factor [Salinifilum ghardaiensis]